MPENPSASTADIKRYAPPNQRNRSLNRRKSGEQFDRANYPYVSDGEKNHTAASRSIYNDHRNAGSSNLSDEIPHFGLIALEGCSNSKASQLLNDRWEVTIRCFSDSSIDSSEGPVMYCGSNASAWGKLPHQLMASSGIGSPGSQMDFLAELRRAMQNAKC